MKLKHRAPRNSPFQFDLETLLHIQLSSTALYGTDEPWCGHATGRSHDDLKDHFLGGSGESQQTSGGEGGTGDDKIDAQGDSNGAPPATPSQSPRGRVDTTSMDHTPMAPSSKTPRGNENPYTSDDEQFTPTSSKDSPYGHISDGKHGDTVEGSKVDLDTHGAQLKRDWAQLHYEQARQQLHKAQLHDDRYRLETQLLRDQAGDDRVKAQLYDQDGENRRAAQLRYDRGVEMCRNLQSRYNRIAAALDRRVQEQQVTDLEVTRLRTRAQRADELEQALKAQRGQKASLLRSIKNLRVDLKIRETCHQKELMLIVSRNSPSEWKYNSESLEELIQVIQESSKVLAIENNNAAARYEQDKAAMEAEINKLQERINTMILSISIEP
jgi:hypothetical protein